jgi:hypothetical protein
VPPCAPASLRAALRWRGLASLPRRAARRFFPYDARDLRRTRPVCSTAWVPGRCSCARSTAATHPPCGFVSGQETKHSLYAFSTRYGPSVPKGCMAIEDRRRRVVPSIHDGLQGWRRRTRSENGVGGLIEVMVRERRRSARAFELVRRALDSY